MQDWTEKYRPKTLKDVIGNEQAKKILTRWAEGWSRGTPLKRAVIIYGKPGIGKTSTALALARDFGWVAVEMNASDVRNAENIRRIATQGAIHETFSDSGEFLRSDRGRRKLIILDEADNLYEKVSAEGSSDDLLDIGGKRAIIDTIKETKQPIVLIANDVYELFRGGGELLRELCETIRFDERSINIGEIVDYLRKIARSEGVNVDNDVLFYIAERCKGDIRSAVRDLQLISIGRKIVSREALNILSYRDREQSIYEVLREIFKTKNIASISRSIMNLYEDPESLILWISENIPYEYLDLSDMADAYDYVSKADIFLGRARRTRFFDLWRYSQDMMAGGVAVAKRRFYPIQPRYSFPSWLIEMKSSKERRDLKDSVLQKISKYIHCSKRKANDLLDTFCNLIRKEEDLARRLKDVLNLTKEEMLYIIQDETIVDRVFKVEERKGSMKEKRIEQRSLL